MAEILPKSPIGVVSSEVNKVFRRLKAIPGDEFRCRWALPVDGERRPEFLVIYRERFGFVIAVSTHSQVEAEAVLQPSFSTLLPTRNTYNSGSFAADEEDCLQCFLLRLGDHSPRVIKVIAFPNVEQGTLDQIHVRKGNDCIFVGKESLTGSVFGPKLASLAVEAMEPGSIELLRKRFSPEVAIPRQIVISAGRQSDIAAGLTECLLDYDQEHASKIDLSLSEDAEAVVSTNTVRLITGVAGSGKSLVLLYRAALNEKLHPAKSQIILTHNKPLIADLRSKLGILSPHKACTCIHFLSWCASIAKTNAKIIYDAEKREWVKKAASQVSGGGSLPVDFLVAEIEWLKDYDVQSLERYLLARRVGRGRSLNEQQRRVVFAVFQAYQAILQQNSREDWAGLPLLVLQRVREGKVKLPTYDFVFVDEAQFFAPVWLKLMQMMVSPEGGQLVMAADPTQGFLKRRESWSASGLNVRGRTIRLQRAYRNTRSILEYAANFYRSRLPNDEEEINLPDQQQLENMSQGRAPCEITLNSKHDELTRVANEILQALQSGANPRQILVIVCDGRTYQLINRLNEGRSHPIAVDGRKQESGPMVRVCPLNSATGLEAAVVFVFGISILLESENSLDLSDEERQDLIRDNTRKLYMAFTRASQRLLVFRVAPCAIYRPHHPAWSRERNLASL